MKKNIKAMFRQKKKTVIASIAALSFGGLILFAFQNFTFGVTQVNAQGTASAVHDERITTSEGLVSESMLGASNLAAAAVVNGDINWNGVANRSTVDCFEQTTYYTPPNRCYRTALAAFTADFNIRYKACTDNAGGMVCSIAAAPKCTAQPNGSVIDYYCTGKQCLYYPDGSLSTCWEPGGIYTPYRSSECPANSTPQAAPSTQCLCNTGFRADASKTRCDSIVVNESSCPVGNPVLPGTGTKLHTDTDYEGGSDFPIKFTRQYRSSWPIGVPNSKFGYVQTPVGGIPSGGWSHNYNVPLIFASAAIRNGAQVIRPDGTVRVFGWDATTKTWISNVKSDSLVTITNSSNVVTGYTYYDSHEVKTYNYSAEPRLQSIKDALGRVLTLTYDAKGRLTKISDLSTARYISLVYDDANDLLRTLQGPYVVNITFNYDSMKRLINVTYPDRKVRRYLYEDTTHPSALTGIINELGVRVGTYKYDSYRRVIDSQKAGGQDRYSFAYSYDPASQKLGTNVTEYGTTTSVKAFKFNNDTGMLNTTDVSGDCALCGATAKTSTYAARSDRPTKTIGHDGRVTFYAYDYRQRETQRAIFPSTYASLPSPPAVQYATEVTATVWNDGLNRITKISEPGERREYTYDSRGVLLTATRFKTNDPTGSKLFTSTVVGPVFRSEITYANGLAATFIEKKDSTVLTNLKLSYTNNRLTSVTDVIGGKTAKVTLYHDNGNVRTAINDLGETIEIGYNLRDQVTSYSVNGKKVLYEYEGRGLLSKITGPSGATVTFIYNTNGDLQEVRKDGVAIAMGPEIKDRLNAMTALLLPKAEAIAPAIIIPAIIQAGRLAVATAGVGVLIGSKALERFEKKANEIAAGISVVMEALCKKCKEYSKPTFTIKSWLNTLRKGHFVFPFFDTITGAPPPGIGYFFSSPTILIAQKYVDLARIENEVVEDDEEPNQTHYMLQLVDPVGWSPAFRGQTRHESSCMKVVVQNKCEEGSNFDVNEVVEFAMLRQEDCFNMNEVPNP